MTRLQQKQKQITVEEFNALCAVVAVRGSFYERCKASFVSLPETKKRLGVSG